MKGEYSIKKFILTEFDGSSSERDSPLLNVPDDTVSTVPGRIGSSYFNVIFIGKNSVAILSTLNLAVH